MIPLSQGDVVVIGFDPSLGHEPSKRRPAVVLSSTDFNLRSSLVALAPVTSRDNGYPFHYGLFGYDFVRGYACVEQLKNLDCRMRNCDRVGRLRGEDTLSLLELVGAVYGI